tara:strand:+ start:61 stop:513 length:453 start_codon:yes stop_codon:yes gene_type:complete
MSRLDYPFYVNGVDRRVEWDELARGIWSNLYSINMIEHWSNFDRDIHDYDTYGDVDPRDLGGVIECAYCGITGSDVIWNLEHILPRSKFPHLAFDLDNITLACDCCNKEKDNKVLVSLAKKFLPYQEEMFEKKGIDIMNYRKKRSVNSND